jgi:molybdopterin-guanine dinucleotide biosynthesis protein A
LSVRLNALVLAGGASRRMGVDKLALPWRPGSSLTVLGAVLRAASAVADSITVLTTPTTDVATIHVQARLAGVRRLCVLPDTAAHRGPLAALADGWPSEDAWPSQEGRGDGALLVVAADLPGLHPRVLRACWHRWQVLASGAPLERRFDGVLVTREGRPQPLIACYGLAAGHAWRTAVAEGESRLTRALDTLSLATVDERLQGWPEWWTRPVHTPDDYAQWLAWSAPEC